MSGLHLDVGLQGKIRLALPLCMWVVLNWSWNSNWDHMNALPIGTKGCWPCKAGGDEEEGEDDDVVVCCCFRTWGEG